MGSEISKAFGKIVKERRIALGLTQESLAEKAGLHPTHIGLIERGRRNPSLDVADKVAKALGEKLSNLIREAEQAGR